MGTVPFYGSSISISSKSKSEVSPVKFKVERTNNHTHDKKKNKTTYLQVLIKTSGPTPQSAAGIQSIGFPVKSHTKQIYDKEQTSVQVSSRKRSFYFPILWGRYHRIV